MTGEIGDAMVAFINFNASPCEVTVCVQKPVAFPHKEFQTPLRRYPSQTENIKSSTPKCIKQNYSLSGRTQYKRSH